MNLVGRFIVLGEELEFPYYEAFLSKHVTVEIKCKFTPNLVTAELNCNISTTLKTKFYTTV